MKHSATLLLSFFFLAGCVSHGNGAPPPPVSSAEKTPEDNDPVSRADRLERDGKLDAAIAELEKALRDDSSNARARYRHAYYLEVKGELRGAALEYRRTLDLDSREIPNTICWMRLGGVHERLGEHRAALDDYLESIKEERRIEERIRRDPNKTGSGSVPAYADVPRGSPLLFQNVARVCIFLGDAESALKALDQARARSPRDAITESLAVRAYQALKDEPAAVEAARRFLDAAGDDPVFADRARELRALVRGRAPALTPQEKAILVDYVRTALRPRMPGEVPEEGFFEQHASDKLLAHDDRAVFVTVIPRDPTAPRFRGRGKGRSLASGLAGAVAAIKDLKRFAPADCLRSAIRIDIARGELEPISLVPTEYAPLDEPVVLALAAKPPIEPGVHGVVLRVYDREVFCLPGDSVTEDLADVKAMLEFAARDAGLEARSWESASSRVFRFRTDSFVSASEGASPQDLVRGEPMPFPEATAETCSDAALLGALWLAQDLVIEEIPAPRALRERLPNGEVALVTTLTLARFHYQYKARTDKHDDESYDEVRHAAAALAMANAFARTGRLELRDAADLAARWLEERCHQENGRQVAVVNGRAPLGVQALLLALEDSLIASAPVGPDGALEARRALRDGLARTIAAAMREDGTFPEYVPVQGFFTPPDRDTRFYTGESILALVRHFKATGERRWLDLAIKGAERRIKDLKSSEEPPLDAWLSRAIAEMDDVESLSGDPAQEARRAVALKIARAVLDHQRGPAYKGSQPEDAAGGVGPPDEV
ncbi:hypothetical protein HY251_04490, partial [bacterium]|nr:hypothetical protein [bacterium]